MFALGPVFFLEVPALHFVFPLFSLHFLHDYNHSGEGVCTNERMWELEAGNGFLTALSTMAFYPLYMWITFSLPCMKIMKVSVRLLIGITLFLLGIILSLRDAWSSNVLVNSRLPITDCGFTYLFLTSAVGFIGLILFSIAAKKYKYRTRNEGLFRQVDVEEVYDHYITQATANDSYDENS